MNSIVLCFWALGALALWHRARAIRRDASELLSPVTVVVAGCFWLYVVSYFTLDPMTEEKYLTETAYTKLLFLSALSVAMFWIAAARSRPRARRSSDPGPSLALLLAALLIGFGAFGWGYFVYNSGGFREYYGSIHGVAGAWRETTAYVYVLIYWMFSGSVILLWVQARMGLGVGGRVLLLGVITFLIFDAWATGSRGHMLRLGLLACVYVQFWRRTRRRPLVIPGVLLMLMPVIFIVVPFLRLVSHVGAEGSIGEALVSFMEMLSGLSEAGPGHELVYAAGVVQAASEQGILDFGYLWLHPIINVIPRLWWPEKPYAAEFSIDDRVLLWQSFGWVPTEGAAPTGVADAFVRLSWFSPLVWGVLGWIGARLFGAARRRNDLSSVAYFFCYLTGLTYMLTQGFNAALYAFMLMAFPLWLSLSVGRCLLDKRRGVRQRLIHAAGVEGVVAGRCLLRGRWYGAPLGGRRAESGRILN